MLDADKLADDIFGGVEAYIDARIAPVLARCAELEAKLAEQQDAARREIAAAAPNIAEPGATAETIELIRREMAEIRANEAAALVEAGALVDAVAAKLQEEFAARVEPPPSLTADEARTIAREVIAETETVETVELDIEDICDQVAAKLQKELDDAVAAIPAPEKGDRGDDADMPALLAHIETEVEKRVAALPKPKDGDDGVGLAGAVIDRDGALVVTLSDGKAVPLGQVVGKDGDPGDPGRDGFQLEDFSAELGEDGRTVTLSFLQGELKHSVVLSFPAMVYRGVFKQGPYNRGDTVTWAGSLWHCDVDGTTDKPGEESKSWTLATKRGRDGKDMTSK